MKPMIVVMANGNARQTASQDYVDSPAGLGPNGETAAYPQSIAKDLIPYMDQTYRTKTDAAHRAIAGLSMGGAQTFYAAFNNIEKFSYVGSFSGGFTLLPGVATPISAPANAASLRGPDLTRSIDPDKFKALLPQLNQDANKRLKLLYLAIGTSDALITTHNRVKAILDEKNVKYTLVETPNYAHEWSYWRVCLQDFLVRLF